MGELTGQSYPDVEPRRTIETVLGPLKVCPECKVQAVCVNGSKCWEAGCCLRSGSDG